MKKLFLLLSIISLYSCGVQKKAVISESTTTDNPELNVITNTEIGISLVSKETGYKYNAIKITTGRKAKPGFIVKEIKEGDVYIHNYYTVKYDLYSSQTDEYFGIAIPKAGGNPIVFNSDDTRVTFIQIKNVIEYSQTMVPDQKREYFKQEFIYNGRVGNALRFIYREYVNDTARPAFTQDLQYDLSESKTIGFRGLRIEVLSATNTNIEYKVVSQFNK